jgi:mRNA interferase MazF
MKMILDGWDGDPDSLRAETVTGVCRFVDLYRGEYDPKRAVKRFRTVDPLKIYRDGKAMGDNLPGYKKYLYQVLTDLQRGQQEGCAADEVLRRKIPMRYESKDKKPYRQPGTVKNWIYRRGDIYLANLNPFKGSEQGGTRPVLVLSNDIGNFYSTLITIAPITSQLKKVEQPTHVLLENVRGLSSESMVCLEQIHAIDKLRILKYLGKISKEQMSAVEDAALESLGMPIPECVEAP